MAGKIKGITLEIGGDTTKLNQALKEARSESRTLQAELKQVNQALKLDPGNVNMLRQKETLLTKEIENQKNKLKELEAAKKKADEAAKNGTEVNSEGYRALEREIVKTKAAIKACEEETRKFSTSGKKIEKIGDMFKSAGKSVVSMSAEMAKAAGKGIAAVAAGVTTTLGAAVKAAGDLEQNMGGSEAVFKNYAQTMQDTAAEAYEKMGLSQSEYLATANKMSALFQGSGFTIQESAEMSAEAMQAAADVASIMGIDISMAMESVAGAAKGNFTMMDNLGVAMNDTTLKAYAQEKGLGELKTTHDKVAAAMQMFSEKAAYAAGNYKKENETIAGSLTTLKASFNNFISGTSSPDQLLKSITNVGSVMASNLKSLAPKIMSGISGLIKSLVPKIPSALMELSPIIVDGTAEVINSLITSLPSLITGLTDILPELTQRILEGLGSMAVTLIKNLPEILGSVVSAIPVVLASLFSALNIFGWISDAADEGLVELKKNIRENADEVEALADKMKKLNDEYDNSVKAAEDRTTNTLAEIEVNKNLLNELENLIDSNGRVKDGYEERVNYILNELNSAYGTEYSLADGIISKNGEVVNSYGEIKKSIEENMNTSMAAAIMKQYEDEYAAAVKRSMEAQKAASEASGNYGEALAVRNQLIDEAKAKMEEYGLTATSTEEAINALNEGSFNGYGLDGTPTIVALGSETEAWQENEKAIKNCEKVIREYNDAYSEVTEIENALNETRAYSAEGNNQKIIDTYSLTADEIKHINDQNTSGLLEDIRNKKAGIEALMAEFASAIKNGNTDSASALESLIGSALSNLSTLEIEYKNAGGNVSVNFADGLKSKLNETKNAGKDSGKAVTEGYKSSAGYGQMRKVADNSTSGLYAGLSAGQKKLYDLGFTLGLQFAGGYKAGQQMRSPSKLMRKLGGFTIKGLELGITPGIKIAEKIGYNTGKAFEDGYKNSLDIHSPSKDMHKVGADTTQGLLEGLDEHTREIIKLAKETGEEELGMSKFYAAEKARLDDEEFDKEYNEKLANAKTAEEAEKIKQEYIEKAQKEGRDAYLDSLKAAADYEQKQYDERVKAAESFRDKIEKVFEGLKKVFGADDELYQEYSIKTNDGKTEKWYQLKDFDESRKGVETYADKLLNLQGLIPSTMFDKIRNLGMDKGGIVADLLLALSPEELNGKSDEWSNYQKAIELSAGAVTAPLLESENDAERLTGLSQAILDAWTKSQGAKSEPASAQGGKQVSVVNNFYTSPISPAQAAQEMTSALKREALLI